MLLPEVKIYLYRVTVTDSSVANINYFISRLTIFLQNINWSTISRLVYYRRTIWQQH